MMVSPSRLNLPWKKDGDQRNAAVLAVQYFNSTLSHLHPTIFFLERSNNIGQSAYMDLHE